MQQSIALIVSLVVIVMILIPFFTGKGGKLASSSTINDPEKLRSLKKAILQRYLVEEKAASEGDISQRLWETRSKLLSNRYIDVSKRLDFLTGGGQND